MIISPGLPRYSPTQQNPTQQNPTQQNNARAPSWCARVSFTPTHGRTSKRVKRSTRRDGSAQLQRIPPRARDRLARAASLVSFANIIPRSRRIHARRSGRSTAFRRSVWGHPCISRSTGEARPWHARARTGAESSRTEPCGWAARTSVLTATKSATTDPCTPPALTVEVRAEGSLPRLLRGLRGGSALLHDLIDRQRLAKQPLALRRLDGGTTDLLVSDHDDREALQLARLCIGHEDGVLNGRERREDLTNLRNCHARVEIPHIDLEHRHGSHSQPHLEEQRDSKPIGRGLAGLPDRTREPKSRPSSASRRGQFTDCTSKGSTIRESLRGIGEGWGARCPRAIQISFDFLMPQESSKFCRRRQLPSVGSPALTTALDRLCCSPEAAMLFGGLKPRSGRKRSKPPNPNRSKPRRRPEAPRDGQTGEQKKNNARVYPGVVHKVGDNLLSR